MTEPIWDIHNDTLTHELVDQGFVSIGWDGLGDLTQIHQGREGLKKALAALEPDAKPQSIAGQTRLPPVRPRNAGRRHRGRHV
ncbi:hypothetical protein [Corynebacterium provencense]|uniref:hypothetical protein n=1 Tax=Corynebacterium provencense TaxID=1737425 RepID=UPI001D1308F1|nr:hypothetical protein [Corynebacterium provencense]